MTATLFSGLGTPFQRLILQEILNTGNDWINSFDQTTLTRGTSMLGVSYRLVFHGEDLFIGSSGLNGSVDRIEIQSRSFVPGEPLTTTLLADIDGLTIPSIADFVANAATLSVGEPDFSDDATLEFYEFSTPARIIGSKGKDFIETAPGTTFVNAGKGNDVVLVGPGSGIIKMGAGIKDAVDFRNMDEPVELDIGSEKAFFPSHQLSIIGAEIYFGTPMDDMLTGSSDNDVIFGREGDDVIEGLTGTDTLRGDDGDDLILGGGEDDFIFGNAGNDVLKGHVGNDEIWGHRGRDRILCGGNDDAAYGGKQRDKIFGGDGNDVLSGQEGDDFLFGQEGPDTLFGGAGNDTMTGGSGKDTFYIDSLSADTGHDTVTDFKVGQDKIFLASQSAQDVTIAPLSGQGHYRLTHAHGTIDVTLTNANQTLTISDIGF